jgi:hypothetical protein
VKIDDFAKAYEPILSAFKEAIPNGGGHAVWALLGGFFLIAQRKDRREKAITEVSVLAYQWCNQLSSVIVLVKAPVLSASERPLSRTVPKLHNDRWPSRTTPHSNYRRPASGMRILSRQKMDRDVSADLGSYERPRCHGRMF